MRTRNIVELSVVMVTVCTSSELLFFLIDTSFFFPTEKVLRVLIK